MLKEGDGPLDIQPETNGPLRIQGNLEIISCTGRVVARVESARLCRCGDSQTIVIRDRFIFCTKPKYSLIKVGRETRTMTQLKQRAHEFKNGKQWKNGFTEVEFIREYNIQFGAL